MSRQEIVRSELPFVLLQSHEFHGQQGWPYLVKLSQPFAAVCSLSGYGRLFNKDGTRPSAEVAVSEVVHELPGSRFGRVLVNRVCLTA